MKQILQISILLLLPILGLSQAGTTVNYTDPLGALTLTYDGLVNSKHSYTTAVDNLTIFWSGTQWEITCCGGSLLHTSATLTAMNPPNLAIGNWVDLLNNPISVLDGSGTTGMVVLPVELIYFTGEETTKEVLLKWQTASELNNEKFEIEKSLDGQEFQTIGEFKGMGTTVEQQKYSFEVKNPKNGISYYRLKQIDLDGQFEYSKVINVHFKGKNLEVGEFYPNPSSLGIVNLNYATQNGDEITVSVFDMTGKLVVNENHQVSSGDNNLSFDFSDLNTGIYIVKIGDERNPVHRKLIIEK